MILKILLPLFLAAFAHANPTVCGVTINSEDELKAFQDNLPKDRVNFKELVNQKIKTAGGAES